MPRYRLKVAYDGTDFHGWQKQSATLPDDSPPDAERPPLRTVQGVLESAVRQVVKAPVNVVGASRTDSGVHAIGQVASFASEITLAPRRVMDAINSRLPADVQVRRARIVPDDFSPIGQAISKGYCYRICHGRGHPRPLFARRTTYFTPHGLDTRRMNEAARRIIGEHDFASLTRLHHGRESTVRTVFDCTVVATRQNQCRINVCGGGFLHNMVRIIAGTLCEIGRGRVEPEDIESIIAARDRTAAGPTLPPEGLCLMWIKYR